MEKEKIVIGLVDGKTIKMNMTIDKFQEAFKEELEDTKKEFLWFDDGVQYPYFIRKDKIIWIRDESD